MSRGDLNEDLVLLTGFRRATSFDSARHASASPTEFLSIRRRTVGLSVVVSCDLLDSEVEADTELHFALGKRQSAASRSSDAFRGVATPVVGASLVTKFMSARSFFDTNVLVYADDQDAPAKQQRALELFAEHRRARTGVISLHVLQEYFVTVTRKLRVDATVARRKVELLAEFDIVAPDVADILAAIDLHRLHGFSFWDALVLRSAKQAGCSILFSEDLQDTRCRLV